MHGASKDIPFTSRQPLTPILNPTFTFNNDNTVKTPAKRKQHTKTVATRPQNRIPTISMNHTRNPFQSNTFHTRQTGINPTPHANPSNNPRLIPQFGFYNQPASLVATILDPIKHIVVFCSSQTLSQEDVRGVVTVPFLRTKLRMLIFIMSF